MLVPYPRVAAQVIPDIAVYARLRILFISRSTSYTTWLQKAFHGFSYSLQRVSEVTDGLYLASSETYDVVVLFTQPSAIDEVYTRTLWALSSLANRPVVIVLAQGLGAADRVRLLRAGADACFAHPWSLMEIHERILALRRMSAIHASSHEPRKGRAVEALPRAQHDSASARFELEPATRELIREPVRLVLTLHEYHVLECLLRQSGQPVPREQLMRYAWPEREDVDPASVNLVVSRLRRKLATHFPDLKIETISRVGYRLSGPDGEVGCM